MKKILTASAYVLLAACTVLSHKATDEQYTVNAPYVDNQVLDENITPEVYALVAARATNKMLDDTAEIYERSPQPTLYIMKVKKTDDNLPDGFYQARRTTKEILEGAKAFTVVNNLNDAQYYLEVSAVPVPLVGKKIPAISYHLSLFANNNDKIGEWAQMIKQVQNDDKSWW